MATEDARAPAAGAQGVTQGAQRSPWSPRQLQLLHSFMGGDALDGYAEQHHGSAGASATGARAHR